MAQPPSTETKRLDDWQEGSLCLFCYGTNAPRCWDRAQSEPSCHPACLEPRDEENKHACTWQYIEAGKMIEFILIYRQINWFIDYRPRRKCDCMSFFYFYNSTSSSLRQKSWASSSNSSSKGNSGIFKPRPYFCLEIRLSTHREQFGESPRPSEDI